jgi:tRNA (adenine57-N1/adenine58-N1)-methyltransferase catalytic subunit
MPEWSNGAEIFGLSNLKSLAKKAVGLVPTQVRVLLPAETFRKSFIKRKMDIKKFKRGPAVMLQKDIGVVLANSNIDKDSKILDVGSGSGVLSCNLARFVKKAYSYDIRKEFLELAKENAKRFGIKNITFRNLNVFEEIKDKNLDLITLDLKDSWKALPKVKEALKENGEVVAYFPNITQISEFVSKLDKDFKLVKVIENIQREWVVDERRARPEHKGLLHTGFLVFVRKV